MSFMRRGHSLKFLRFGFIPVTILNGNGESSFESSPDPDCAAKKLAGGKKGQARISGWSVWGEPQDRDDPALFTTTLSRGSSFRDRRSTVWNNCMVRCLSALARFM
jgi:hypothetical protein